jgi:hypothetical protein
MTPDSQTSLSADAPPRRVFIEAWDQGDATDFPRFPDEAWVLVWQRPGCAQRFQMQRSALLTTADASTELRDLRKRLALAEGPQGAIVTEMRNAARKAARIGGFGDCTWESIGRWADALVLAEEREKRVRALRRAQQAEASKDGAYRERDQLVAVLADQVMASGGVVGLARHPESDTAWEDDWRNIVYMDTPRGQVSWHFHDSEMPLFEGLPPYTKPWDGHTTAEKYERLGVALTAPTDAEAALSGTDAEGKP